MDILIELSKADFTGLIKSGAPPSEYVPEVEQIVNRLGRVSSITELQNMIWQVFTEMFGGTYDIESVLYQDVSRQLWQGWQTRGLVPGTTNN